MASHDPSNRVEQGDALVCRSAALLLRAGQDDGLVGEELAPALDRLLTAVSIELESNRATMPASVSCAAARLAEHVVKRSSIPVHAPRSALGHPTSVRNPLAPSPVSPRRATVPYARCIRLGRMG